MCIRDSKGAAWDATEQARYTHIGTHADAILRATGVTFEAVQASTNVHPAYDNDQSHWTSVGIPEPMRHGITIENCTKVTEIGNAVSGAYTSDLNLGDVGNESTFEQISLITSVGSVSELPQMTPKTNNGNRFILVDDGISKTKYFCQDGQWVSDGSQSLHKIETPTAAGDYEAAIPDGNTGEERLYYLDSASAQANGLGATKRAVFTGLINGKTHTMATKDDADALVFSDHTDGPSKLIWIDTTEGWGAL